MEGVGERNVVVARCEMPVASWAEDPKDSLSLGLDRADHTLNFS